MEVFYHSIPLLFLYYQNIINLKKCFNYINIKTLLSFLKNIFNLQFTTNAM